MTHNKICWYGDMILRPCNEPLPHVNKWNSITYIISRSNLEAKKFEA